MAAFATVPRIRREELSRFDDGALHGGVLPRRVMAFVLDVVAISLVTFLAGIGVFLLGIVTFGLGWLLYGLLYPAVALAYVGLTLGGSGATPGMRAMSLVMLDRDGRPPDGWQAMGHALLFWVSVAVVTPFVLAIALFHPRGRLPHDMLLGFTVRDAAALRRLPAAPAR